MTSSTAVALRLRLPAPDPETWVARHQAADAAAACSFVVVDLIGLLADDAAALRAAHAKLQDEGTPSKAAAMYLAGWFGGGVAHEVGRTLALAGAGVVAEPSTVRWHLHPDGWPERVDLGHQVVVTADHPWAGLPAVEVAADQGAVLRRSVDALVALARPIVDTCRGLAKVGRAGLWNEIADGLGMALSHQVKLPVEPDDLRLLTAALDLPDTPWTKRPSLRMADSDLLGRVHVAQKGGCCLAYTGSHADPDPAETTPEHRAYMERFPRSPDEPHYCSTCTFRTPEDCSARQLHWLELTHRSLGRA